MLLSQIGSYPYRFNFIFHVNNLVFFLGDLRKAYSVLLFCKWRLLKLQAPAKIPINSVPSTHTLPSVMQPFEGTIAWTRKGMPRSLVQCSFWKSDGSVYNSKHQNPLSFWIVAWNELGGNQFKLIWEYMHGLQPRKIAARSGGRKFEKEAATTTLCIFDISNVFVISSICPLLMCMWEETGDNSSIIMSPLIEKPYSIDMPYYTCRVCPLLQGCEGTE